jgi:hypothetical protein
MAVPQGGGSEYGVRALLQKAILKIYRPEVYGSRAAGQNEPEPAHAMPYSERFYNENLANNNVFGPNQAFWKFANAEAGKKGGPVGVGPSQTYAPIVTSPAYMIPITVRRGKP